MPLDDFRRVMREERHQAYNEGGGTLDDVVEFYVLLALGIAIVLGAIWFGSGWLDQQFNWGVQEWIRDVIPFFEDAPKGTVAP